MPIIQSWGNIHEAPFTPSDLNELASDIIICKAFAQINNIIV